MSTEAAAADSAVDNRSAEDTGKNEWDNKLLANAEAMSPEDLSKLSIKDLEKQMGMDIPDRTDKENGLANAPTHEIDRMIETGEAVAHTEDTLAALATAALADPEKKPDVAKPADTSAADAAAVAEAAAAADATAAAAAAASAEPAAQVVQTRDGKGVIPYHVLENARARIAQVEAENAQLKGTQKREAEDAAVQGALTEEDIAAMRGEFPDPVVDALVKLNQANIELKRKNVELTRGTGPSDEDAAKQLVQDLIDQNPVLSKWQSEHQLGNTTKWNQAVALDDMLREDPDWADKGASDRFDEVLKRMGHPVQPVAQGKTPAQLAQETADAAAAAALQASQRIAPTHSDLPGGTHPAQTDQSQLDSLSVVQLEKAFEGKSPEQIEGLLARFG